LFVDRIVELRPERAEAAVTFHTSAPFFHGHFPTRPIVPGVILIEALAQTSGLLLGQESGGGAVLAQIRDARFRRPVGPGAEVHLHAELLRSMDPLYLFRAVASCDGEVVAEAELTLRRG
jgi:3-hydroxymyristoyl/3-hydroxydecanoyl-(acyl carrier protein) dehydratase